MTVRSTGRRSAPMAPPASAGRPPHERVFRVTDRPADDVDGTAPGPKPLVPEGASALSPLVRPIVCNNPGLMTGPGTNTYLVGVDEIVVVDPGPDDATHLDAIAGCGGDAIR